MFKVSNRKTRTRYEICSKFIAMFNKDTRMTPYFTPCSSVSVSSVSVINVSIVSIVNLELENARLAVAIFQPFNHSLISTSHLLLAVTMKKAYWKVIVEGLSKQKQSPGGVLFKKVLLEIS